MFARIVGRPVSLLIVGASVILGVVASGQGQQLSNKELEAEFNKTFTVRLKLFSGERPPTAEDQKLMDVTARWYIHRVTWPVGKAEEWAKLHETLERDLLGPLLSPSAMKGNRVFVEQLGKHMAKALRQVLTRDFNDDNRVAMLNAALMLPPIARLKQEDVGDLLVELLKDKKCHDAIKLYAARAMREFFPARILTVDDDPKDAKVNVKFKRDTDRVLALTSFIDRKGPVPADEAEREAIRFMRREAVASLAQAGAPALAALKKKGVVEIPVAYELLRVLVRGKEGYDPPPSIAERVEAALGLCHLRDPGANADYDPSVAVYAVGQTFADYATEYQKDYGNIFGRKDPKNIKEGSKIPTMPWRVQSERFKQAVKELVVNTKGTPAQANAKKLETQVNLVATSIAGYASVQSELGQTRKVADALAPKSGQIYKLKGPQIDPQTLQGAPGDGN